MFEQDDLRVDGRVLDGVCCGDGDPHRVYLDELLRWHFRQSVLAGVGVPVFEHDFAGKGMVKVRTLRKERLEMEFSARLYGVCLLSERQPFVHDNSDPLYPLHLRIPLASSRSTSRSCFEFFSDR